MEPLSNVPALAPPPGVTPNFTDPYNASAPVGAAIGVLAALATLGFFLRIFTKACVMRKLQFEDYMLTLGWCFFIVFIAFAVWQFPSTTGRHQWDVPQSQIPTFALAVNYAEMFYCFCMLFTRLAILLQIKRIFVTGTKNSTYWLTNSLIALHVLYTLAAAITEIAQCIPRDKIWNPSVPGSCIDSPVFTAVGGAFNVAFDLMIFLLPIYAILRLRLNIKQKLGICAIFTIGLLACISSVIRLYYSVWIISIDDITYNITSLAWTGSLEAASAILVAAFPVYPRLCQFFRERTRPGASGPPINRPTYETISDSPASPLPCLTKSHSSIEMEGMPPPPDQVGTGDYKIQIIRL